MMHGAMESDRRLTRLVDRDEGIDKLGIGFIGEAMVPNDKVSFVRPAFLAQVLLALLPTQTRSHTCV